MLATSRFGTVRVPSKLKITPRRVGFGDDEEGILVTKAAARDDASLIDGLSCMLQCLGWTG